MILILFNLTLILGLKYNYKVFLSDLWTIKAKNSAREFINRLKIERNYFKSLSGFPFLFININYP